MNREDDGNGRGCSDQRQSKVRGGKGGRNVAVTFCEPFLASPVHGVLAFACSVFFCFFFLKQRMYISESH